MHASPLLDGDGLPTCEGVVQPYAPFHHRRGRPATGGSRNAPPSVLHGWNAPIADVLVLDAMPSAAFASASAKATLHATAPYEPRELQHLPPPLAVAGVAPQGLGSPCSPHPPPPEPRGLALDPAPLHQGLNASQSLRHCYAQGSPREVHRSETGFRR